MINDFYSLINNRKVNIYTVLFSINSKSEGCQEMAAETGVEKGRIRIYHKHNNANVAFSSFSAPPSSKLFRLQRLIT